MNESSQHQAYGVFKPVGHVVVSFGPDADLDAAVRELSQSGFADVVRYNPEQMVAQVDADLAKATLLSSIGQEQNLVKAHRALAEEGYSFLVVKAPKDEQARQVADICQRLGAERAQSYGRLIIEELIEHPDDEPQTYESNATGLDAQTPSGLEKERG